MFSDSHHRCPHVTEQVSQLTEKVSSVTPVLSHVCRCDMGHCTCDDFTCDILEGLFYRRQICAVVKERRYQDSCRNLIFLSMDSILRHQYVVFKPRLEPIVDQYYLSCQSNNQWKSIETLVRRWQPWLWDYYWQCSGEQGQERWLAAFLAPE